MVFRGRIIECYFIREDSELHCLCLNGSGEDLGCLKNLNLVAVTFELNKIKL